MPGGAVNVGPWSRGGEQQKQVVFEHCSTKGVDDLGGKDQNSPLYFGPGSLCDFDQCFCFYG